MARKPQKRLDPPFNAMLGRNKFDPTTHRSVKNPSVSVNFSAREENQSDLPTGPDDYLDWTQRASDADRELLKETLVSGIASIRPEDTPFAGPVFPPMTVAVRPDGPVVELVVSVGGAVYIARYSREEAVGLAYDLLGTIVEVG